jgi:hypothetical protein
MAKYQLIIDDQVADVYDGTEFVPNLSYSISDINDIDGRTNPTTSTIKLPGTNNNRKIFKYPDNVDVKDFNGQKVSFKGELSESGTTIISGVVNLKNIIRTKNFIEFEITIIGSSGDWVQTAKEEDLMGIDLGSPHEKNATNIAASHSGTLPYAYGLVNFGYTGGEVEIESIEDDGGLAKMIFVGNNTVHGLRTNLHAGDVIYGTGFSISAYNTVHVINTITETYLLVYTYFAGDSSGKIRVKNGSVAVEEIPLLISVYEVFTKIFSLAGYVISSVFTESAFFKALFILPGKETYPEGFAEDNYAKVGLLANYTHTNFTSILPFPFTNVISDVKSHHTTISRFYTTQAMLVVFKASFKIKQVGAETSDVSCYMRVNGVIATSMNRKQVSVTMDGGGDYVTLEQEAELRLGFADYVEVGLNVSSTCDITVSVDDTFLEATVSNKIIKGSWIIPGNHLPDIKQLDFIKAIRHLFNLYFFTDVNMKKVYIEPRDSFYLTTQFIDLTDKLDISKAVSYEELGADISKKLIFKYKDDSNDWGLSEKSRIQGWNFSEYMAELTNKFSPSEEKKIENPLFAATLMDVFDNIGLKESYLPKIWKEPEEGEAIPEKTDEYVPRILYFAGERSMGDLWKFEEVGQSYYPLFCSYDKDTTNDNSLLFDNRAIERELYARYYANYVRTLNESRKITAYFKITAADIQRIICPDDTVIKDFRSLIYFQHIFNNTKCRLESISEYKAGLNKTSKVVLITDNDNSFQTVIPQVHELDIYNLITSGAYKNGVVYAHALYWYDVRTATSGTLYVPDSTGLAYKYGVGSFLFQTYFYIERGFLYFDTSVIPSAATIIEAYLDIYKTSGDASQEIEVFGGTQGDTLTGADFHHFNTVSFGKSLSGALGLRRVILNTDGRAWINKTGYTKFALRDRNFDALNVAPAAYYNTFKTHFTNAPAGVVNKLTIKYML